MFWKNTTNSSRNFKFLNCIYASQADQVNIYNVNTLERRI